MPEKMENMILGGNEKYFKSLVQELDLITRDMANNPEAKDLEENIDSIYARIKDLNDGKIRGDLMDRWSAIEKNYLEGSVKVPEATKAVSEFREYISNLRK